MSNLTTKDYFNQDGVKKKFNELLGKRSTQFITSVLQIVNSNKLLMAATPESIYNACTMAATLDLPINQNLGFAWIVPYKNSAQFQMGWKGFVQLAQRTGQYLRINVVDVYANQFKSFSSLTEELDADFSKDGEGEIVGYACYFKLINGFEKTVYWSKLKVNNHAMKYSQAYKSANGMTPWKDAEQFHEMAKKTVLKNTLSKWGILSVEMQTATITDQAIIKDANTLDVDYIDNTKEIIDKVNERIEMMLNDCKTIEDLNQFQEMLIAEKHILTAEQNELFNQKITSIRDGKNS
jgi:recombination protein RecT